MFQITYRDKYNRGFDVSLRRVETEEEMLKFIDVHCQELIDSKHTIIVWED